MKPKTKSTLFYIFQPAVILYYVALLNFAAFWIEAHLVGVNACLVCPWYYPWSYNNEPSIILAASLFLLFKRWWSCLVSAVLSGYLIGYFLYIFTYIDVTPGEEVIRWLNSPNNILTEGETQYFFALIIFCFAVFNLGRMYYTKVTKQAYL